MGSAIKNECPAESIKLIKYTILHSMWYRRSFLHSTDLSTGPPRPPRPAESYLVLVSGSRERVNKHKGVSVDVRKWRSSVLLSVAAKLRVVAERDLGKKTHKTGDYSVTKEEEHYLLT